MSKFDLSEIQGQGSYGLDALFAREPKLVSPTHRRRIASLGDLSGFLRLSNETLIHKSERDLWALRREGDQFVIELLFDDDGNPVKG